jgi:hypothetical protein
LLAHFHAFEISGVLFGQFLPARLHGEILLRGGDGGFSRIAVLRDQVTGKAR